MTTTKVKQAIQSQNTDRWTYTRYLRETAEGEYFAVVGGERLMSPSPNRSHQTTLINLASLLKAHIKQNRLGTVMVAPFDVYFSEDEFVQPDILFVAKEHADRIADKGVSGAPDLVIEILSPGSVRTDRITKRHLYARYRVPEYWLISPTERTVEILSLKGDQYETAGLYEGDEIIASPALPGLQIQPTQLFDE